MNVSDNARAAHQELTRVWGSKPKVFRHGDDLDEHFIMIAEIENSPTGGIRAVGTLGLSDYDLGDGNPRVELVGAFPDSFGKAPNIAATCAFNGFKDGLPIRPDSVHPNVLKMYLPKTSVPHIMLTDPFLWDGGPETLALGAMTIAWLMMVPISEAELAFAEVSGFGSLTSIFEERQIDIFDLNRSSVV